MGTYVVWDDVEGRKLTEPLPEVEAKAYALEHDPLSERMFLEDEDGDQLVWNPHRRQWEHA